MDNVLNTLVTQTSSANSELSQFCPSVLYFSLEPGSSHSIREQICTYICIYKYIHIMYIHMGNSMEMSTLR